MALSEDAPLDLDETSFNLENVDMIEDDVDVHNNLIGEDRVGVDVTVEPSNGGVFVEVDHEKKKEFDKKKEDILSEVPDEIKARFGNVYFSTFGKFVGPVLIMNPYSVEPGPLRDQWIGMFHNCKKSGREAQMTHLTYWYGQFNELNNAYSFQKTSQLLSYELGMKKTEKKRNALRQKRESGKKLSTKDLNFIKGFDEMEADRKKNPSDRHGYVDANFMEEYHKIVEEAQNKSSENTPEKGNPQTKLKAKKAGSNGEKKKKKKLNKLKEIVQREKEAPESQDNPDVNRDDRTMKPKKTLVKKRTKKSDSAVETSRPKKKTKGIVTEVQNDVPSQSNQESVDKIKKGKKSKGKATSVVEEEKKETGNNEDKRPSAYEEYAALLEESSHGGSDDGSLHKLNSDSDEDDDDYVEASSSKAKKKKVIKRKPKDEATSGKTIQPPKKKAQRTKTKIEKRVVKGEKKAEMKLSLKKLHKKEQQRFHQCEVEYLPLLHRWEKAITDRDSIKMVKIFDELLQTMESFTAPFIEEYGMAHLMKRSKGFEDEKRRIVQSKFKKVYYEKKEAVPTDFKPVREVKKYVPIDSTSKGTPKSDPSKQDSKNREESSSQIKPQKNASKSNENPRRQSTMDKSAAKQISTIPKSSEKSASSMKSNTNPTSDISPPPQKQSTLNAKAEKRKSFSLGKLMRPGSSLPASGSRTPKRISSSDEISGLVSKTLGKNEASCPSWIVELPPNEGFSDENRIFGLEFLQQAVEFVPERKPINLRAIAQNLEKAIFNWSTGIQNGKSTKSYDILKDTWENKYWNKIHDLVASISGKRQTGTIAGMIAEGKFSTPDELIGLNDDDLWRSFHGDLLEQS